MYDFPFMWGSQRKGPDLSRVGLKYSDAWHKEHLVNPRSLVSDSIMPAYAFLSADLDVKDIERYMEIYKFLGVPYSHEDIEKAKDDILAQAAIINDDEVEESFSNRYKNIEMRKFDAGSDKITEFDAVISYLQTLGNKAYEEK